jgi:TRAP-type C4-dicarboxylate transport system permease small subunit
MDIPVLIIFSVLFVIVALQFFTRYVLNDSLGWTEEIARYLLIVLGFVGGITCVRKGKHIYLEFAYGMMPRSMIKPVVTTTETLVAGFWGYCGWLAIELAQKTRSNMVSIDLPKSFIYYTVSAGCFLMAVFTVVALLRVIRTPSDAVAHERLNTMSEGI